MSWWRSQRSKTVELAQARTEAVIRVDSSGDLRIAVGVLLEEIARERTRLDTALRFALAPDAGLESVSRVESATSSSTPARRSGL